MSADLIRRLEERHYRAIAYAKVRAAHPTARAADVWAFVNSDSGGTFQQFVCRHEWPSGIDEDTGRETAMLCLNCGADGDA